LEPSNGFLAAINAIPIFKEKGWVLSQEANCGALQLTLGTVDKRVGWGGARELVNWVGVVNFWKAR